VNESSGLEQGFTLAQRPGTARDGEPLVIALAVEGKLHPARAAEGDAVLLKSGGRTVLRYGGLRSWDARGRAVPVRLEVREQQVRLLVEDRDAEYPLVVDPTWSLLEARLTAPDGVVGDLFGWSVSVSGDTAVVGMAPSQASNTSMGKAYVFVRSGATSWTLQQELCRRSCDVVWNQMLVRSGYQVAPLCARKPYI
jgi:FG-GAP repeat